MAGWSSDDSLNAGDGKEDDSMEYAKLGNTGMDVSRICLGCMGFGDAERCIHKWVLDEDNSRPIIQKALELGSISSIPPTSIPSGGVRKSWGARCGTSRIAMRSSSLPRSTAACARDRMAAGSRARRS